MKNKDEILESGILEQYVLGLTTLEENTRVEGYISQYPELREHLDAVERAMETIAHQQAIVPPEHLRAATLDKISEGDQLKSQAEARPFKWIAGIAASIAVIIAAYGWNTSSQLNDLSGEVVDLQQKLAVMNTDCALIKDDYATSKKLLALYMDETTEPVKLAGNDQMPGSDLIVFWNKTKKEACMKINNLNAPPDGHVYQIWADVEGEMLPLGTFENETNIVTLKFLPNAESLNVTIEEGKGSDHPNVSRLIMSSKV